MDYTVKVVVKQGEITDKEKAERVSQFRQAFVTAAVDYYSNKQKQNKQVAAKKHLVS